MAGAFAGVAVSSPQSAQPLRWTRGLIKLQEHSVMYPVDMLKVRFCHGVRTWHGIESYLDTPPSPQATRRRLVYGNGPGFSENQEN
jgi:hypothetical protein